jgi:hypothetical protein
MDNSLLPTHPQLHKRNPKTKRSHQIQFAWQILLPLFLGTGLGVFGLFALLSASSGNVERSAQLATIVLALPVLIIGIVLFLFIVVLIYMLGRLIGWIPPQAYRVQRGARGVSHGIVRLADMAAKPLILFDSWSHAANKIFKRIK